ncbi:MAG: DUF1631 family protein [Halioglobus sp.]
METRHLNLTPEQFPFPCSVSDSIRNIYAGAADAVRNEQVLELDELLDYLRSDNSYALGPMDTIRAKTEEMGDPGVPTPEQIVVLEWLQKAYQLWSDRYPIEKPISQELRKLLPAIAAHAISDDNFLIPGAHIVHEMFDCIHNSAVGWQPELGRAGVALEKLIAEAEIDINLWFQNPQQDLYKICTNVIAAARKDQDRAERMTQRLVDAEKGRLRTASARWKSAEMINHHLTQYQTTPEIADFLRGPWYESAQLVLLKYHADSDQWAQMTATTETLLQSLAIDSSATEEQRQRLFDLVTTIPRDVKQWLLSLHMDPQAINDVVGLIESAHMRLLRNQEIALEPAEFIFMEGMTDGRTSGDDLKRINAIEPGRWFSITRPDNTIVRAQLVLKLSQEQQCQFANKAGLKCLELGFEDFLKALDSGKATPLRSGYSFSACLAHAAGIRNLEDYSRLTGIEFETTTDEPAEETEQDDALDDGIEASDDMEFDPEEVEKMYRENLEAERIHREREQEQEQEQTPNGNTDPQYKGEATAEQGQTEQVQHEPTDQLQQEQELALELEPELELELAFDPEPAQPEELPIEPKQAEPPAVDESVEGEAIETLGFVEAVVDPVEQEKIDSYLRKKQDRLERIREENALAAAAEVLQTIQEVSDTGSNVLDADDVEIRIPMGTWMGFHDTEVPTMAKLAVHDKDQDSYIFVNREGIKMRALNKQSLIDLLDDELIDLLDPRTDFRDEITRIKIRKD